jgi:hypothetical protein
MKNLARCFYVLFALTVTHSLYADEWITYSYNPPQVTQTQTTITPQPYNPPPQPVLVYQYTPYVIQQPVVVEQRCFLHRTQKIVYIPQVQYFYHPVWVYR